MVQSAQTGMARRPRISVGIINNMPDAALQPTERQFLTLLAAGADDFDLRVHLFSLPGLVRSGAASDRVRTRYLDYDCLSELHMDALIVTGAVPNAASLADEPFWPHLIELAEWAKTRTLSVLWSCLSAHAAVLHMDGIARRRLPKKLSGLYRAETCGADPLTAGLGEGFWVPHSRYNELPEDALRAAGYRILGRSGSAGADMFSKSTPSLFVLLQGHPEYDGDTLMREYRRDVLQYLAHERGDYPDLPENYFNADTEVQLRAFAHSARLVRRPDMADQFPDLRSAIPQVGVWQPAAARILSNWINTVADLKMRQLDRRGAAA
jgi:homoserine O-succinyltransferase/O-acetyltransferase